VTRENQIATNRIPAQAVKGRQENTYDPQTKFRAIQAVFQNEESEDWPSPKPGNFFHSRGRRQT